MGALVSIPVSTASACASAAATSLCTSASAAVICSACHCESVMATRIAYALMFCVASLAAWVVSTPALAHAIERWSLHYIQVDCAKNQNCFGVLAVHRIMHAVWWFHLVLALLSYKMQGPRSPRAVLQNGYWGAKIAALLALAVLAFFVPNGSITGWVSGQGILFAGCFILFNAALLVDFAHSSAEACIDMWERDGSNAWKVLLVSWTLSLYVFAAASLVLLGVYMTPPGCGWNTTAVVLMALLCVALTFLCVHPAVQEANPRSGLAQSSIVLAYGTYQIGAALVTRDDPRCNPLARSGRPRMWAAITGAAFTFAAIAYTTTRAAKATQGGYTALGTEPEPGPDPEPVTTQPHARAQLRVDAIRSAVDAGSLPQSVLDAEMDAEAEAEADADAEQRGAGEPWQSFLVLHFIYMCAASYVAMLLTDWKTVYSGDHDDRSAFVGSTATAMHVRILSALLCMCVYAWSLIAPLVFPERFAY